MKRSYEAQVLGRRSPSVSQNLITFLLWQAGGGVAIALCSQAHTFTLDKLQLVYGVVALVVGGAEAWQRQEWVLFALGVLGGVLASSRPLAAVLLWGYGAVGYGRMPSILSVSLAWYALVVLVRAFGVGGEG